MEDICVLDYSQDLEYWGVDTIWLETCCETKFSARKQFIKDTSRKEKAYQDACKVRPCSLCRVEVTPTDCSGRGGGLRSQ